MAKHYGCRVTTTTLSQEQYAFAQEAVKRQGLEDKVTLLLQDYRDLDGQYDKLVSIEMIEAVGHQYMPRYFEKLEQLLKPEWSDADPGDYHRRPNVRQLSSWCRFYPEIYFPGGCLPSMYEMCKHLGRKPV